MGWVGSAQLPVLDKDKFFATSLSAFEKTVCFTIGYQLTSPSSYPVHYVAREGHNGRRVGPSDGPADDPYLSTVQPYRISKQSTKLYYSDRQLRNTMPSEQGGYCASRQNKSSTRATQFGQSDIAAYAARNGVSPNSRSNGNCAAQILRAYRMKTFVPPLKCLACMPVHTSLSSCQSLYAFRLPP